MALFYASGENLIDVEEMKQQLVLDGVLRNNGALEAEGDRGLENPFTEVGIGNPLLVEILNVYTGDAPKGFLGNKPDLLMVSGVKAASTFDASPRAINRLHEDIKSKQYLQQSALEEGSSVVYYTDCLTKDDIKCTFELLLNGFKRDTVSFISSALTNASALPVFISANLYLLAGAVLTKMTGELIQSFEAGPLLSDTLELKFGSAGLPNFKAGHYVIFNEGDRDELEKDFKVTVINSPLDGSNVKLCHKQSGKPYNGNAPHIIVSVDGKSGLDLEDYAPRLASAALLQQFREKENQSKQTIDALETISGLYSDFTFRQKAQKVLEKIKDIPARSPEFAEQRRLFEALIKNIRNPIFKIELQDALPG